MPKKIEEPKVKKGPFGRPLKPETIVERQRRVPLGGPRQKLSVSPHLLEKGFQYRWVNDSPGRLEEFKEAGYEFVTKEEVPVVGEDGVSHRGGVDSRMSKMVGLQRDNSPLYAYLMRQKNEYYEEDQSAKEADLREKESSIMGGKDRYGSPDPKDPKKPGKGGRYIPAAGTSLTRD